MMTYDDIKKVLVIITLMIVCQLLLRLVNINKGMRGRQIAVSMLAPLAVVGEIYYIYSNYDNLIISAFNDFFSGMIIVWNLLMVAAFLVFKLVLCPIAKAIWSRNKVMAVTCASFYVYNDDVNKWFLKPKYVNMRKATGVLAWTASALSAAILSIDWILGPQSEWYMKVLPLAAVILITEWYNFINGYTFEEYKRKITGDDISSRNKGAYYKLRKVYEGLFPSALLVSHTGNEFLGKEGSTVLLRDLAKDGDNIDNEIANFFLHMKRKEGAFDTDLIKATDSLMHGKSVVILNPFYRDLSDYLLLPIVTSNIYDKKVLVVTGRNNNQEDIRDWLTEIIYDYGKNRKLWRVEKLESHEKDCEIGIISFSQIYDKGVLRANTDFFKDVSFVLLIEASRMLSTAQVGLNILSEYFNWENTVKICVLDRDSDGLVDILSHVFKTEITDVVAPAIPRSVYTVMGWDASGDFKRQKMFNKETRYLGNGVEIAAVALRNQIKSVSWYSADKAPIEDIKWIAGQYYPHITRYINLPTHQHSIDDRLFYNTNLWGSEKKEQEFVIAEDEFCNIFETLRMYVTRGTVQSFVNVISENYLLRDYMRYNRQLFMTDAKAIPTISPVYSKTEKNILIKLILMMVNEPVDEEYIKHEFILIGLETEDIYGTLIELITKHFDIKETLISIRNTQISSDMLLPKRKREYYVNEESFNKNFATTIKNAYFIVEDEAIEREVIDAKLFGQITQLVMPHQFVVNNGKVYKVHKCSHEAGCILRRASDLYNKRVYYRQLRYYTLETRQELVSYRTISDISIYKESYDFSVISTGYLELEDNNNLRTAKVVDLRDDPNIAEYKRNYIRKNVLRLMLPDTDESVRYTITVLLSELFRTLFPNDWPYIAVLTNTAGNPDSMLEKYHYHLLGNFDKEAIYIVEDCVIDLGILEAIDDNLLRIFEILTDYLDWHFTKIKERPLKDPVLDKIVVDEEDLKAKGGLFTKIKRGLRKLFGIGKSAKENYIPEEDDEGPVIQGSDTKLGNKGVDPSSTESRDVKKVLGDLGDEDKSEKADIIKEKDSLDKDYQLYANSEGAKNSNKWKTFDLEKQKDSLTTSVEIGIDKSEMIQTDEAIEEVRLMDDIPNEVEIAMPVQPSRYQQECYLNLGFEEIHAKLVIERVKAYFSSRSFSDNTLTKARRRKKFEGNELDFKAENFCDFCGKPLSGVSYEVLADGRTRCNDCSTSAITNLEQFREIYHHTEMMMENVFEIIYPVAINIKTADAKKIAKQAKSVYKPSKQFSERVMAYAQYKSGEYSLFIENGCPKLVTVGLITHEMTHIWQFINWDRDKIEALYRQDNSRDNKVALDIVYEGMAVWAAIQMLYAMGETYFAEQQEQEYIKTDPEDDENVTVRRRDAYGFGFNIYRSRFGLEVNGDVPPFSPFKSFPPIDPEEVKAAVQEINKSDKER